MLTGSVVYFSAFDVSYDVERARLRTVLGIPLVPFVLERNRRLPATQLTEGVWVANLPPFAVQTPAGEVTATCALKVFAVGALSITVRVPFSAPGLADLVGWHSPTINGRPLHGHLHELARSAFADLQPLLIKPAADLVPDEPYTLFQLDAVGGDAEAWFAEQRRAVAALLTQEEDPAALSEREVEESTTHRLSYYRRDLMVVDWDAALAVEDPQHLDEVIYPVELANVQLAELECYDRQFDAVIARSYNDVQSRRHSVSLHDLESAAIDLARSQELLANTGKLFGDWHLARVYRLVAERFHLDDWYRALEAKRATIDAIQQSIKNDRNHRLMVILEVAIVVLFIIDLIPLFQSFLGLGAGH